MKRSLMTLLAFAGLSFLSAHAQLIGAAHNLVVQHGVYQVGPNSDDPLYTPQGFLLTPGGGYPTVRNPVALSNAFLNAVTGSPGSAFLSWTTVPQGQFGGASTTMVSIVAPFTGFIWWPGYFIRDVPSNDGVGSYNVSGGNILYQNGPSGWFARAGIFFPFRGFVFGPNAYVAGAMAFECTIYNAFNVIVDQFILGVHFGFDGLGPRPNVVGVYGTTPHFQAQWFEDYGTTFAGFGLAWTNVFIPPGGKVLLEGRLTLLADPDSGFDYTNEFDNDPVVVANLPDFGYSTIPEPASMTALGVGLLALLARRRRRAS